jgi:hypothetical protein
MDDILFPPRRSTLLDLICLALTLLPSSRSDYSESDHSNYGEKYRDHVEPVCIGDSTGGKQTQAGAYGERGQYRLPGRRGGPIVDSRAFEPAENDKEWNGYHDHERQPDRSGDPPKGATDLDAQPGAAK